MICLSFVFQILYYTIAAEKGDLTANCNFGVVYEQGDGVAKDMKKALQYYTIAAEEGHPNANCNLGVMYTQGHDRSHTLSPRAAVAGSGNPDTCMLVKLL